VEPVETEEAMGHERAYLELDRVRAPDLPILGLGQRTPTEAREAW